MAQGSLPTRAALPEREIPQATVARLAGYLHVLARMDGAEAGPATISSDELAGMVGVNPAKLRKDLSYLGSHGIRGVGYDVTSLVATLQLTLGTHEVYPVAVVGAGHLGSALAGYAGFAGRGFPIRALFDVDVTKIGTAVAGVVVEPLRSIAEVCRERGIAIGVIATPESAAQQVADALVAAGVRSVLNFAPGQLTVPDGVLLRRVDLSLELHLLAFHEARRDKTGVAVGGQEDR